MPHSIPDPFRRWINAQLESRNFSQAEASRRAGLNQNAISDLLTGKVNRVSLKTAQSLARLFGASLIDVLRLAGYLEGPINDEDLTLSELVSLAKILSPEERRDLLDWLRWRTSRR